MSIRIVALIGLACLLSACSLSVKPRQYAGTPGQPYLCLRYAVPVDIAPPANGMMADPFLARIEAAPPVGAPEAGDEPVSPSMLFLSGGSQHGAFGAGFLDRWSQLRGGLPRFRVVTAISTGALQSTFVFTREPREIVNRYAILAESELLEANTTAHVDGPGLAPARAAVTIVRKGALTELVPLRRQLLGTGPEDPRAILTATRLGRVAAEAAAGRKLLVGAVELDSGGAVAFDLTALARDYLAEPAPAGREALRQCYAEALIASSSVPIAASPTFIEGRMFIDGGARFGVLPAKLQQLAARSAGAVRPNLFIIVNGSLEVGPACDLGDCPAGTPRPSFPATGDSRAHAQWSFPALAFRSLGILINQSYVASVELARRDAEWCRRDPLLADGGQCAEGQDRPGAMAVHFIRILPEHLASPAFAFPVNGLREPVEGDTPFAAGSKPCNAWADDDETLDSRRPHEFQPRYMRCLIRYGAHQAEQLQWDRVEPRPAR